MFVTLQKDACQMCTVNKKNIWNLSFDVEIYKNKRNIFSSMNFSWGVSRSDSILGSSTAWFSHMTDVLSLYSLICHSFDEN